MAKSDGNLGKSIMIFAGLESASVNKPWAKKVFEKEASILSTGL